MATYKMLKTQRGVRKGEVHSVLFHEGKTYEIDDDLAEQFKTLDAVEESSEEPVQALPEDDRDDIHENWLDKDPAVLRHGELTAAQVIAKDESDKADPSPVNQVEGKAEGDEPAVKPDPSKGDPSKADDSKTDATKADTAKADDADAKSKKSK